MGGIGKTMLVKEVYQSQELISCMFDKRACVTVTRPFILEEFLKSLVMQLNTDSFLSKQGTESSNKKDNIDFWRGTRKAIESMRIEELKKELSRLLEGKRCLIVLDDLSSTVEWDLIIQSFPTLEGMSQIIVTTREENIAKHCSNRQENIMLKVLEDNDALDLFTKKVFKGAPDLDKHPELIKEAKLILKKCNGLPLAIVTIGGFLAKQPKTPMEWRKLNEHISAELEINSELEMIKNVLIQSYDGLPYHLKHCFLYLSIFSEDYNISRRRLVHRWTAEGYSSEVRGKPMEVIADSYFMELIDRSMILPSQQSVSSRKGIDSCKVHDLMREISISKSVEENLVFRLEAGCSLETQGIVRHLTKDIRGLTRLRKLAVTGVNKKNCQEFCSALADLSSMESLSLHSEGKPGLHGCLDGVSSPPENLQGLKLVGNLVELPGWIGRLQNLVKLKLHNTWLTDMDATIQTIGKLPNLAILGLWTKSFHDELRLPHLTFHPEAFLSLMVLELDYVDNEVRLVEFEEGAMPKLELLLLKEESHWIRGLSSLPSLKEAQLSTHPKKPVLKRL
ncbi:hypothetical protein SETIT_6G229100v2 [Setaria italica]|uniref:Uncharacterized protein n=1 Tax=Setaria italica TaxID=4555 RepID=A0A368RPP5_SETIT|nr:hypothetical protein SETIT_6G229100v2 [Setaria italica]